MKDALVTLGMLKLHFQNNPEANLVLYNQL